jgi:hypothetical protein
MRRKAFDLAMFFLAAFSLVLVLSPATRVRAQVAFGQLLTTGQMIIGNTANGPTATQVFDANGNKTLLLGAFTSGQLTTLSSPTSGYLVVNITTAQLCMSTGTAANTLGAWVVLSTAPVSSPLAASQVASCHS